MARPTRVEFPGDDPKREKLVGNVRDALLSLPIYFQTTTSIEGLEAGDLFSLNSVLGGTIEVQTVSTLNRIRGVWDPDNEWDEYGFERSSQSFPDVRLVSRSAGEPSPVLGIELKGWYLLSKEGEPSFRYTATRNAATPYDLLVVVPWRLSNVLSGVPVVYEPFIEQAQHAADLRNHYWENLRGSKATGDNGITSPPDVVPYPAGKTNMSDKPKNDGGGNFGRIARVPGLMKDYCEQMLGTVVAGIEAKHWVSFFKTYSDNASSGDVDAAIGRALTRTSTIRDSFRESEFVAVLRRLTELVEGGPVEGDSAS
ncbi:hypothetical protein [Subtercola endophyticus]|uniref:hypothetical protein n=1 Tax=Subtercola endophyticus TaxID=2895559 RepID=UPI001E3FAFF9|nr:hypothetical protein [Subtercola endophyticus]UFS58707.1 hypothetical protein LQ955_17185 [Subtercola endophyticus]